MKKISVLLLLTVLMGCGVYGGYGFDYAQLSSIERGMSFKEVTAVLGEPAFRDFDKDREAWTFRALGMQGWSVVKVWFKEGKVVEMKSYLEDTGTPAKTNRHLDGKKDSSSGTVDAKTKVYVSPEGKHYIQTGNIVVTPEGKHIIVP